MIFLGAAIWAMLIFEVLDRLPLISYDKAAFSLYFVPLPLYLVAILTLIESSKSENVTIESESEK